MSVLDKAPTRGDLHEQLAGSRLPRWGIPAVAVGGFAIALLLDLIGAFDGVAQTLVCTVALYAIGQTAWSFIVEGRRHAVDRLMKSSIYGAFALAIIPLVAIMFTVVAKGLAAINAEFITGTMRNVSPRTPGGGIYHALIGTIEQVLAATVIAVPIGVLIAIYLVEYGRGKLAAAVSFFVDVMTGVPSIVAGLFVYTCLILTLGMQRSGFAASLALVLLMLPVIVRTTEEMLKIVPRDLREAAYALGVPKYVTILRILVPTALPGIVTGVMLAVARVAGETAPLLLTTFLTQSLNINLFEGPQAALPTFIWDQIGSGTPAAVDRAWGGALILILFVAILYIAARLLSRLIAPKSR